MQYLITGGCGFIGSHLAETLVAAGHTVTILDNMSAGKVENAPAAARIIVGDVTESVDIRKALSGIDGVFHLAAIPSVELSRLEWQKTHDINVGGMVRVLEAVSQARIPVVYASSAAVYGDALQLPLTEKAPTMPLSAYGADKLGCELHARVAAGVHGVSTVGLRFFNVYGPRQNPSSMYCGVISKFLQRLTQQLPVDVHGDGEQSRDFTYVKDVAAYCMAAMEYLELPRPKAVAEVVNVCTGTATTLNQLLDVLESLAGYKSERRMLEARLGDIRASCGDPSALHALLGKLQGTSLEAGLSETVKAMMRDVIPA